jgi:predicted porin
MKKSLLALAALGAFAGAASAQTNVTIYGLADIGVQRTDTSQPGVDPTWALDSGLQSGSRLGFRGSEDLGGGLSAIFNLESGFNLDTGGLANNNVLFSRQAWVGLNGGFGAVKLGRQNTPIYNVLSSIDPFAVGLAGDIGNVFKKYGSRMSNTVNYSTPELGGFSGALAYGFGEAAGNTSASRQIGASAAYVNGPINAQVAYHRTNDPIGSGSGKTALVGGVYNFGVAAAHAAFADNKADGASTEKSRDWMLGVSAPVGAGSVLASFIRHDDRLAANVDADQWALGYVHSLSKRTNLYTSYGKYNRKLAGSFDDNKFNVGMRHKF